MKRKLGILIFAIAMVTSAWLLLNYRYSFVREGYKLRTANQIQSISVELGRLWMAGSRPAGKFEIVREEYGKVLSYFVPNKRARPFPNMEQTINEDRLGNIIGHIRMATSDGDTIQIDFYWSGPGPVLFSVKGAYYEHDYDGANDESLMLYCYLRDLAFGGKR